MEFQYHVAEKNPILIWPQAFIWSVGNKELYSCKLKIKNYITYRPVLYSPVIPFQLHSLKYWCIHFKTVWKSIKTLLIYKVSEGEGSFKSQMCSTDNYWGYIHNTGIGVLKTENYTSDSLMVWRTFCVSVILASRVLRFL